MSETPEVESTGWDAYFPRICSVITFYDKIAECEIHHLNTHFDHVGGVARANSAELILDRISDKEKVILSGVLI